MGGGFAGSIIGFTLYDRTEYFMENMAKVYGEKNVVKVSVVPGGPRWQK